MIEISERVRTEVGLGQDDELGGDDGDDADILELAGLDTMTEADDLPITLVD